MRISDWSSDVCSSDLTKIINGQEQEVSIESIHPGDLLRVKPGEKIPVDGSIREGEAVIDESMISGEPVPVEKTAGDKVSSGTINGNKSFVMVTEKVGRETLLSRSEEHTSELQSLMRISYAVFCLKKKKRKK